MQATRTLASDKNAAKAFGTLAALNDAHSVTFLDKDGIDLLEVDGICVNSKLVVMNEVKATPSLYDVEHLIKLMTHPDPSQRPNVPTLSPPRSFLKSPKQTNPTRPSPLGPELHSLAAASTQSSSTGLRR